MADPKPRVLSPEEAESILQKNVANIVKKAAAGKPLTPREQQIIAQYAAESGNNCSPSDEWVGSYEALGKVVGLHRASFPRLRKDYPDCPAPRANGDHSVPEWRQFLANHAEINCKSPSQPGPAGQGGPTKSELEIRKLLRQCEDIEFDHAVKQRRYILTNDATRWSTEMVSEFVKVLDSIPSTLAPDIVGIPTIAEAEKRIRAALENAKKTLHTSPWGTT